MRDLIIQILIKYTLPKDQLGFVTVEEIADKILMAINGDSNYL